jgi:hypothetical protein
MSRNRLSASDRLSGAHTGSISWTETLTAVDAWASMRTQRGPDRVRRIRGSGDIEPTLAQPVDLLVAAGPVAAYDFLVRLNRGRIAQFGSTGITNFLYFVQPQGTALPGCPDPGQGAR